MRYILNSVIFAVAAAQVPVPLPAVPPPAVPLPAAPVPAFGGSIPQIPVLPVPGVADVINGNGYNSVAASLTKAAQSLGLASDNALIANAKLTGDLTLNPATTLDQTLNLVKAAGGASATLWNLAYDLETKVCSIATSINQQNFNGQQANLVFSIQAQVTAISKLQSTLQATVTAVQAQISAFTASERAILVSAIQALVASVNASAAPIQALAAGLRAVGVTGLSEAADSLYVSATTLATFAAKVNFIGT